MKLSKNDQTNKARGSWKFNASLLRNEEYCGYIKKKKIEDIKNDNELLMAIPKWEYLKCTIRKYSVTFSKKLTEERKGDETKLIKKLLEYYSELDWSAEDKHYWKNY